MSSSSSSSGTKSNKTSCNIDVPYHLLASLGEILRIKDICNMIVNYCESDIPLPSFGDYNTCQTGVFQCIAADNDSDNMSLMNFSLDDTTLQCFIIEERDVPTSIPVKDIEFAGN